MKLSDNAERIARARYYFDENEDWEGLAKRVGIEIGKGEKKEIVDQFIEMIYERDFLPGGRILRNAGRLAGSMMNCNVLPITDSIEGIGSLNRDLMVLWSEGCGVGVNFSPLRPKGAKIVRKGGESSGTLSFIGCSDRQYLLSLIHYFLQENEIAASENSLIGLVTLTLDIASSFGDEIESGCQRRSAGLALLHIDHPEIESFIDAKTKDEIISNFNISVGITEEFLDALRLGNPFTIQFGSYRKEIDAEELWNKILTNMLNHAEPGLINLSTFRKNNSYYYNPVICTNPCQPEWATVMKKDGITTIGNIEIGDEILSEDGWVIVTNKVSSGYKDVYEYKTDSPIFYGTEDHKVVNSNEKVKVKDAKYLEDTNKSRFKINSVKFIRNEEVFDITVNGKNHTYFSDGTNVSNCGELPLPAYGSCCLGSLVLPHFVSGKSTNWKKLEKTIYSAVRFLDDVININHYSLKELENEGLNSRRIGLGTMGLADYLFAKNIRYSDNDRCLEELDKLYKFIRDTAYKASVELAKEKGPFPKFEKFHFCRASFVKKLPAKIRMEIENNGIRNVTLLTQPPTGTSSLVADTTSGIEPLISKAHKRNDRTGEAVFIHPIYKDLVINKKELPDWFVDSYDLKPEDHLTIQATIQKYVDSAVSKTINLPKNTTVEDLDKWLRVFIDDLKGVTIYKDGSRKGQILTPIDRKDVEEILKDQIEFQEALNENEVACARGTCEI